MKQTIFLLLLIPSIAFSQRQLEEGSKITKSDFVTLNNSLHRSQFKYFNEFLNTVGTATGGQDVIATNSGTGAATSTSATSSTTSPGVVRSTTGTTATGRTAVAVGTSSVRFGGGTWSYENFFSIATTSTVTERYQLLIGFFDVLTAANQVDGAYFLYDEGGVSTGSTATGNWQQVTASNSTRTFNATSTAVSQGAGIKLRVEVNAAANSVSFYINDVLQPVAHTTNIPTGAGRETGFGWLLIKSIGTTARTVDFDYISVNSIFTTQR